MLHTLFSNEERGWAVVLIRTSDSRKKIRATGPLLGLRDGDDLRLSGRWVEHPKFGRQLQVESFVQVDPSTIEGLRRYLGSGRIRGTRRRIADRIVDAFGLETLSIIEQDPQRLCEIRGIGRKTAKRIQESLAEQRGMHRIMVFLTGHGISPSLAVKVHKRYGARALEMVRENPFGLVDDIIGVGFLTADRMARSLGFVEDAPERQQAGILYALRQAMNNGHLFLPSDELVSTAAELLAIPDAGLIPALHRLTRCDQVVIRSRADAPDAVYLPWLEQAEARLSRRLGVLARSRAGEKFKVSEAIKWYQRRAGISLAPQQQTALARALTAQILVITGGPGTGKTTLVRGLTMILGRKGHKILLAAPTGRAAKRMQEATGVGARTIHRLLEFSPVTRQFTRNRHTPLEGDLVVVDEASMLDVELAADLCDAVGPACRLVLVGDADQLPSVGPGNVLADIIASGVVPVMRLDEIFRQAEQSLIVVNAHRINRGEMPILAPAGSRKEDDQLEDFYVVARDDPQAAADIAIELVTRRIPRRFALDPIADIQVLAPMHRGELGVSALNQRLQAILTPGGPELEVGSRCWRVGDKVMQTRNNYELDLYNGDLGRVMAIDSEERELMVSFDSRPVKIPPPSLEDLVPAYACTIHKAQGSEYPAVVILLHHQHHIMLQRNLLYTAITRGKRLVIIVGSRRALSRAVQNASMRRRNTMLARRLSDTVAALGVRDQL